MNEHTHSMLIEYDSHTHSTIELERPYLDSIFSTMPSTSAHEHSIYDPRDAVYQESLIKMMNKFEMQKRRTIIGRDDSR
jgi:hypothetical protein